jgi:hypothetical protein
MRNDYRYSYCGAEDAAKYLKSVGADRRPVMGYLYGIVAVQAYFDHNIQANRPTAYFHHGVPLLTVNLDIAELQKYAPDYVIFPCWFDCRAKLSAVDSIMRANSYSLAHRSDGYLLSKRGWDMRQDYYIYHRN